jgi:hypothetical protein
MRWVFKMSVCNVDNLLCLLKVCLHNILQTAASWSQIYFMQSGHASCFGDKLVTVIYAGTGTGSSFSSGPGQFLETFKLLGVFYYTQIIVMELTRLFCNLVVLS